MLPRARALGLRLFPLLCLKVILDSEEVVRIGREALLTLRPSPRRSLPPQPAGQELDVGTCPQPRHRQGRSLLWPRRRPHALVLGGGDVHAVARPVTSREWPLQGAQCDSLQTRRAPGSPRPTRHGHHGASPVAVLGRGLVGTHPVQVFADAIALSWDNVSVVLSSSQAHEGPSRLLAVSSRGGSGEGAHGGLSYGDANATVT